MAEKAVTLLDAGGAETLGMHLCNPAADIEAIDRIERKGAERGQDPRPKETLVADECLGLQMNREAEPLTRPGFESQGLIQANSVERRYALHVGTSLKVPAGPGVCPHRRGVSSAPTSVGAALPTCQQM